MTTGSEIIKGVITTPFLLGQFRRNSGAFPQNRIRFCS
jgi:hypothetical protein